MQLPEDRYSMVGLRFCHFKMVLVNDKEKTRTKYILHVEMSILY